MTHDQTTLQEQLTALQQQYATLESQLRQRNFELQVLNDLSCQIGYSLNYDDLFRLMLQHLHRIVPYVVSGSFLMLDESYDLFIQYTRPIAPPLMDEIRQRMVTTLAYMGGQHMNENQVRLRTYRMFGTDATYLPVSSLESVFQVPLIVGPQREVKGLLFVGAEQDSAFTEEQVRILYTVANHAGIAVQQLRALLMSEEQRLENLVRNLPDGVLLLDEHRHIVLMNPAGSEYLSMLSTHANVGDVLTHLARQSIESLLQPFPVGGHEIVLDEEHEHDERWVFEVSSQPMTGGPQAGGWTLVIRNITGRKRAEEQIRTLNVQLEQRVLERTQQFEAANRDLRNERDLLHSIMETSPVGIMMADRNGRFTFANSKAERVLGLTREQIFQRHYNASEWGITDLAGQPISDEHLPFRQVFDTGESVRDLRHMITCPDGGHALLSINAAPLNDEQGHVDRVIFSVRDVTRYVRAEEALRENEAKLRLMTMQMPSILWKTDADLHITDVLGSGLTRLGYQLDDFVDKEVQVMHDTANPHDAPLTAHRRALRGLSAGYEMRKDDREFEVRVDPLRNKEGQIEGCIGLALDITERKQAEEQIRTLNTELEQRVIERTAQLQAANEETRRMQMFLHSMLENIPDMIFVKESSTFTFVLLNKAAEEVLGMPREAMIGKSVGDVFAPDIAERMMARDKHVAQQSQSLDVIEDSMLVDGTTRIYHTRLVPVLDEQEHPQYILGISADITEQKHAEQELQEARQAAEAATLAKSEFLANVSHEIRTPLNGIIGMTQLLLDTTLSNDQRDFTETVRISSDALLAIINDVLDFSKIEAGKMELTYAPFHLHDCIEESLALVSARASEKHLNLAYTIAEGTPISILGDISRLRQILVNLLSNAVKFTEQGEVVVHVNNRPLDIDEQDRPQLPPEESQTEDAPPTNQSPPPTQPLYEIHISVRDTGIGIPRDHMERLFKSFSQIDSRLNRKYGGTGLGLAISKNLAELMGGTMWVESERGRGSTFHFNFLTEAVSGIHTSDTAIAEDCSPSPLSHEHRVSERSELPILSDMVDKRVLIVSDNETNRHILTRHIVAWGMLPCVTAAHDEALLWVRQDIPLDIAVIDMHHTESAGLDIASAIRHYRPSETLPLIVCLSLAMRNESHRTTDIALEAIITRPIKPSLLYDTLVGVLTHQRLSPARTEQDTSPEPEHPPVPSPPAPGEALHQSEIMMGQHHPLRILLVEDNVFNKKVALRFLEKLGYYADLANNGLEALEALRENIYDVVLMDIQMPDMDGVEATRRIRRDWPPARQPRIIAMTAHAMQGDRQHCLDVGMDDYVSKPVKLEDLVSALEQAELLPER